MNIKIEKGIVAPVTIRNGATEILRNMEAGDSILLPIKEDRNRWMVLTSRILDRKYTSRRTEEGYRIWRTA